MISRRSCPTGVQYAERTMGWAWYLESDQEKNINYRDAAFVWGASFQRGNVAAPRRPVRRPVSLRPKRAEAETRRIEAQTRRLAVDWELWRRETKEVTPLPRR